MDIAPIRGHTARLRFALQKTGNDGGFARAHRPHGKDVIALVGNLDAKFNGAGSPFLADDFV